MVLAQTSKYYFQLLGTLLLTTQTAFMVLAILLGILSAFASFLLELTYLGFSFLFSNAILILVIWIFILKYYGNQEFKRTIKDFFGESVLFKTFPCQICHKLDSDHFVAQCCHAFHKNCVVNCDVYIHAKICPKCSKINQKYRPNKHLLFEIFTKIITTRVLLLKLLVLGAVLYGCYLYAHEQWNFPDNLLEKHQQNQ